MKHSLITTLRFVNKNICIQGDRSRSKSSYGPVLHSYIWMTYSSCVDFPPVDRANSDLSPSQKSFVV
jgi:hypothetical protein